MSVVGPPIVVAEGRDVTLFGSTAEAESYPEPVDVAEATFRGYDAEGRSPKIETDGSRASIRATGGLPGHAGEPEELLRGFLERAGEPADSGCDLPHPVAARDRYKVETAGSFHAAPSRLFDDPWRSFRGRELRRKGR